MLWVVRGCPGLQLRLPARRSACSLAVGYSPFPYPSPGRLQRLSALVVVVVGIWRLRGPFQQGWDAMARAGLAGTAAAVRWVVVSRCPGKTGSASTACHVLPLGTGLVA